MRQLTERVKRNPYCVVLLDEIEKAHPDTFNVLLQVFEDGHLTDGLGNTVDFKNTILIMTSNIGARFIEKKGRMGFASNEPGQTVQATNEMVMGEVKRTFNPEFVNRIDEIIIFDALTDQDLVKITRLLVEQLNQNLKEKGITISIRDEAVEWLLARTLPGPLLRRAPAAAGDPAPHRGRAVGGLHPRPGPRGPADRGGGEGRRAVVPARRAGRSVVGMKRTRAAVLGAWLCLAVPATEARAQAARPPAPVVERIEILNNQYLQKETLLFYISTKPGDAYDERKLREDFKRLWDTGFLDDLQIEVVDGPGGKVVRFKVTERKRIQIVDFRGSKDLTTSNIEDALKKADAQIKIDTFYDPAKARKVETIIKEMLAEKGRPFGYGQARGEEHRRVRPAALVHHRRRAQGEGPRDRLRRQPGLLGQDARREDEEDQGRRASRTSAGSGARPPTPRTSGWGARRTRAGDRGRLEDFYLDHGYVTARIGQPKISYTDKPGASKKKPVKLMRLEIPVSEGEQYKIGEVKFEGLTVLKEEFVRSFFKMTPGDVYNDSKFKKAYEKLRDVYGSLGYFQWTGSTQRKPDPEKKVVDITVKMEEDKQYFLGRISFTGNDSTRDKVIRREIYMNEGEVFNTEALKMSIKRVNQLGYFKPMEGAPDIRPSETADNKVDVTFKVEEQNRNQFTFGGGVSGLEGTFINASFSTTNFLGAGETFQIYAQSGKRTKNYSLSVSEPYFLDRPITAGVDLFRRKITYYSYANVSGYTQESTGASLVTGFLVGKWSRAFLNYTYEVIKLSEADPADLTDPFYSGAGGINYGPQYDPLLYGDFGKRTESRITPNLVYNTVDSPFTPRAGMRHTATFMFAGGPLGGNGQLLPAQPRVDHLPARAPQDVARACARRRPSSSPSGTPRCCRSTSATSWAARRRCAATPSARSAPSTRRGARSAATSSPSSTPSTTSTCSARCAPCSSSTPARRTSRSRTFSFDDFRISTGAEVRFIMPVLNVPFRLIYAFNPNRTPYEMLYVPYSTFKFAVGTTF